MTLQTELPREDHFRSTTMQKERGVLLLACLHGLREPERDGSVLPLDSDALRSKARTCQTAGCVAANASSRRHGVTMQNHQNYVPMHVKLFIFFFNTHCRFIISHNLNCWYWLTTAQVYYFFSNFYLAACACLRFKDSN